MKRTVTGEVNGKVALVIGGRADIGLSMAKRFSKKGARRRSPVGGKSELDKAVTAIDGSATAFQGDISSLEKVTPALR